MRLFVAIPLPSGVKEELHELMQPIDGVRWQDPTQLHITLKFLGETEYGRIDSLVEALSAVDQMPFTISIRDFGYFPKGKEPRVLWIGVGNGEPVVKLQQSIEIVTNRVGFKPENRKFTPHVTLGKTKGVSKREVMTYFNQHKNVCIENIPVGEFVLYESTLSPDGATHEPFTTFSLSESTLTRSQTDEER